MSLGLLAQLFLAPLLPHVQPLPDLHARPADVPPADGSKLQLELSPNVSSVTATSVAGPDCALTSADTDRVRNLASRVTTTIACTLGGLVDYVKLF